MKKITLYGHGSSLNHGCEAIIKSTVKIFQKAQIPFNLTLSTLDETSDKAFGIPVERYIQNRILDSSLKVLRAGIHSRILGNKFWYAKYMYTPLIKTIRGDSVYLSVGGDNYCTAAPRWLYYINRHIDDQKASRILWGASVESETMNGEMVSDLSGYRFITARESITYEALREKGISAPVHLVPDPAFVLDTDESALLAYSFNTPVIGINFSPVIAKEEPSAGMAFGNYCRLIEYILENTHCNILLIPHVLIDLNGNNDHTRMKPFYNLYKHTGRVMLAGSHLSASQYKALISRCEMFVGARTHSTIAAYSTCVPTVVVGYSVKARGIARDLFGREDGYVVPVQKLEDESHLTRLFAAAFERKEEDRKHLQSIMPAYKERAFGAGDILKRFLEG